jgi:S1-C subfamily serine protease
VARHLLIVVALLAPLALLADGPEAPEVVAVRGWPAAGPPELAAGVVVAPGRVLTAAHTLAEARRVTVQRAGARVARVDRGLDLALLDAPGVGGEPARIAEGGASGEVSVLVLRDGELVSRRARVRRRITARLVDEAGAPRRPTLELATDVRSGDSGAPVVGADGRVAGIVYARSTRREGTAYAVWGPDVRALACDGRC